MRYYEILEESFKELTSRDGVSDINLAADLYACFKNKPPSVHSAISTVNIIDTLSLVPQGPWALVVSETIYNCLNLPVKGPACA